jgi:parallel beta-helix repeat protein
VLREGNVSAVAIKTNINSMVNIVLGKGTTYYFDARDGDDNNLGTSEDSPFKTMKKFRTLKLLPGDNVLFKRGEVWNDDRLIAYGYPSGTKDEVILYSSYGDINKPRPIITSINKVDIQWKKTDRVNIWESKDLKSNPRRLFKNNREILNARTLEEISSGQSWYFDNNTKILYLYSLRDPNNDTFRFSYTITCYFQDQQYITVNNLDIRGGTAIKSVGSSNIHIVNSKIGFNSSYGLVFENSTNNTKSFDNVVENNIFDSGFTLDYSWIAPGGTGADYIGSNDGLAMRDGTQNSIIKNNFFKNWNHASIVLLSRSENAVSNNEIFNNTLTSPDIAYGGRFDMAGNSYKNEIHHNLIKNISVRNQVKGHDNYFHHNMIDGVKNSHLKDENLGQCFSMAPNAGDVYNNLVEFNTFKNCDGAGIQLNFYNNQNNYQIYDNVFKNNLIENADLDSLKYKKETDLFVSEGVGKTTFENNSISSKEVFIRGKYLLTNDFDLTTNKIIDKSIVGSGNIGLLGSTLSY